MSKRRRRRADPQRQPYMRSARTGEPICTCRKGYASEVDGLCTDCRGGVTAWDVQQEKAKMNPPDQGQTT